MYLIRALESGFIISQVRSGHGKGGLGLAVLFLSSLLLVSCNSKKYLEEDQSFLRDNEISFKSSHPVPNKSDLFEKLIGLYQQKATRTVAGIPRHVFYYQYKKRETRNPDIRKWDNAKLEKNKPVIYDSTKAESTTAIFRQYLGLRGYRNAEASYRAKTQNKETTVYYQVNPGPRMHIDTFTIVAEDADIQRIVDSIPESSHLIAGSPLDIELYNRDRVRISRLLQNHGYATFDESFISPLEVDTAGQRVKAIMRILNPTDSTFHLIYRVGDITVYPDYNETKTIHYVDTMIHLVTYQLPDSVHFSLKPDVIERSLHIFPGYLTNYDDWDRTRRNLYKIELIRAVSPGVRADLSDSLSPKIDYSLLLTRNKKIEFQSNLELTYSNISRARRSLLGIAANIDYRDLNTFRGAEVLNVNLETGFEFNFLKPSSPTGVGERFINSINIGVGGNLSFPRFMDPLRLYRIIGHKRDPERKALFGTRLRDWLDNDASTRMSLGFSFVDIADLYQYYTLNANISYVMQPDAWQKLTITRTGIDLFVPNPDTLFEEILERNKFQRESFGKQLYTGLVFRDYLAEFNSKSQGKGGYFKILHNGEISGLEVLGINLLSNRLSGKTKEFILDLGSGENRDTVRFSHFIKGEVDLRYYLDFGRNAQLAVRFNTGVAAPFGPFSTQVPYVKQFFVGGALSNRAWQIRELGPGSFEDTSEIDPNLPFYQTGDVKIDLSVELRFPLFWYFHSAVFLDAANVWAVGRGKADPANFDFSRFYREFGVGYGYGIRLDFDFFILRFDLGYKLFNPYPVAYGDGTNKSRFLHDKVKKFPGGAEPQIAIGHKF